MKLNCKDMRATTKMQDSQVDQPLADETFLLSYLSIMMTVDKLVFVETS